LLASSSRARHGPAIGQRHDRGIIEHNDNIIQGTLTASNYPTLLYEHQPKSEKMGLHGSVHVVGCVLDLSGCHQAKEQEQEQEIRRIIIIISISISS